MFQRYRTHFRKCLKPKVPKVQLPNARRSSCPNLEHGQRFQKEPRAEHAKVPAQHACRSPCQHAVAGSRADCSAKAAGTGRRHGPFACRAKSAPNTPRLTNSCAGSRKNAKHKDNDRFGTPHRRGRRASCPEVQSQPDVPVEEEEEQSAASGAQVPVKTLWMFEAEQESGQSGQSDFRVEDPQEKKVTSSKTEPEEPLPLSCQARRFSSGFAPDAVTWRTAQPLPIVSCRLAAATVPGRPAVMALGGADALGFSLDAVHIFENCKWTALPPLPTPRQALAAASLDLGSISGVCVLGGRSGSSCGSATVAADFFDLGAERWVDLPPLTMPRAFHASAALEGKIYVLGGMDADGRRLASVEWLDPREGNGSCHTSTLQSAWGFCTAFQHF